MWKCKKVDDLFNPDKYKVTHLRTPVGLVHTLNGKILGSIGTWLGKHGILAFVSYNFKYSNSCVLYATLHPTSGQSFWGHRDPGSDNTMRVQKRFTRLWTGTERVEKLFSQE